MEELRQHFRPEFLNRVDEILIFHRLTQDHLRAIVDIQLRGLQGRLAERNITLSLTDKARELLAERGFDPVYGARPLKRLIQKEIQDQLALRLLNGDFADGDQIEADAGEGKLVFRKQ
jgi:ATP-dependent Clp protease ATP-binding subunit ClpB